MENPIVYFRQYLNTLQEFRIKKSEEYNCIFNYDKLIFAFECFEDDPYYFRISIPNIFQLNESNKEWAIKELNDLSTKIKVARLIRVENDLWAVADEFVYSMDNIEYLFQRTISCLKTLYNELKKDYNKFIGDKSHVEGEQ